MTAQTVTGPVAAEQLGMTLPHEHVIFGYPGYAGDVTLGPFDHAAALASCTETARRRQLGRVGVPQARQILAEPHGRRALFAERAGLGGRQGGT